MGICLPMALSSFSGSHKGTVVLEASGSLALPQGVLPLSEITASPWDEVKCIATTTAVNQTMLGCPTALTLQVCPHSLCSGSGQWQSEQPGQHSSMSRTLPHDHSMTAGANIGKLGKLLFSGTFYKHLSSLFASAQQLDPAKQYLRRAVPESQFTKVTLGSARCLHNSSTLQEYLCVVRTRQQQPLHPHVFHMRTPPPMWYRKQFIILSVQFQGHRAWCWRLKLWERNSSILHLQCLVLPWEKGSMGGWWINPCKDVSEKSHIWGFHAEKSLIFLCYTKFNPSFKSLALLTCNTKKIPANAVLPDKWWQGLDCSQICSPEEAPVL